ncbi:hypothetical protein SUGI_1064520 [Cryptomeria japonica]|nr:hypothetical protein SUGI_1064520 [Cryptomeria japonica]
MPQGSTVWNSSQFDSLLGLLHTLCRKQLFPVFSAGRKTPGFFINTPLFTPLPYPTTLARVAVPLLSFAWEAIRPCDLRFAL